MTPQDANTMFQDRARSAATVVVATVVHSNDVSPYFRSFCAFLGRAVFSPSISCRKSMPSATLKAREGQAGGSSRRIKRADEGYVTNPPME